MKKLAWLTVIIILVSFITNSYLDKKELREQQKVERAAFESKIRNDLKNIVSNTGAYSSWESDLSKGEGIRLESILTIELERAWLHSQPILYIGSIKDIKTKDDNNYTVSFERNLYGSLEHMFLGTELELSIVCGKDKINSFLQQHAAVLSDDVFDKGVAVIAKIDQISSTEALGYDSERIEIKTGIGHCVSMLFTSDVQF